jgi:hypothetical protein
MNPLNKINKMVFLKRLQKIVLLLSFLSWVGVLFFFISSSLDHRKLDQAIRGQINTSLSKEAQVAALNTWTYYNRGFAKNRDFYIFKNLGPTPVQVLKDGGDCADKSRLLSSLLTQIGIDSTLVMLYDNKGNPTHTVVEARLGNNRMVADPVFNLVFPIGNGKHYGIEDLKNDPDILINRILKLGKLDGKNSKVTFYQTASENYSWPKTINWDKNPILKKIAALIRLTGTDPYLIRRPHFLEDPKSFLMYISLLLGLSFGCLFLVLHTITPKYP